MNYLRACYNVFNQRQRFLGWFDNDEGGGKTNATERPVIFETFMLLTCG